jgi:hypothetical protein
MPPRSRDPRDPADRAWQALLADVPRREPAPAFSRRLMAATRAHWPEGAASRTLQTELAVTAGVVAAAAAMTIAPVLAVTALFVFDTGVAVESVARGFVWMVEWLTAGVSIWEVLARMGRVAATAMASPAGTMVLLGGILTAWLALAGLTRVMPGEQGDV